MALITIIKLSVRIIGICIYVYFYYPICIYIPITLYLDYVRDYVLIYAYIITLFLTMSIEFDDT